MGIEDRVMSTNLPDIGRAWKPLEPQPVAIDAEFVAAFAGWAQLRVDERSIALVDPAGVPMDRVSFDGEHANSAWLCASAIDGRRSCVVLAAELGLPLEGVVNLVQALYEAAVVTNAQHRELPALVFYANLRSQVRLADRARGKSELLQRYAAKRASKRLVLGYLIETYHFAAAAASHQALAVATAPTLRLKTVFSEHLSEEYWHYAWLKRGLLAAGLTDAEIDASTPTLGTLGVINHLRWLATSDLLAYSACLGIIESDPTVLSAWVEFWQDLVAHGKVDVAAIAPFREHSILDCQENHDAYGMEAFGETAKLSGADQSRIRQRVSAFRELVQAQHRSILEWYGDEEGPSLFAFDELLPLQSIAPAFGPTSAA
jgi:pyrroloquinoline quinone (PQQ) biosynthesis protein C